MDEEQEFPKLTDNDPVVERMVRRSRQSQILFRRFLWFLGFLGSLGICWCIYLAVTGQYEKLGMVVMVFLAIIGCIAKGFAYLRSLEDLQNR